MNERPKSITVVCWIIIVMAGISLIISTLSLSNPAAQEIMSKSIIPISIQYIIMYAGLLIMLLCGIAMLKGKNWARLLYVGWSIIGFIIGIATSPMKALMIPGIIVFLIVAFSLFRPKANEYFKASEAATKPIQNPPPTPKKSFSDIPDPTAFLRAVSSPMSDSGMLSVFGELYFHDWAKEGNAEKIRAMLDAAMGDTKDFLGQTVLAHPIDVDKKNLCGNTPLMTAAEHGQLEVVKLLLEYGANIAARDVDQYTPLWLAAKKGHLEVVKYLLAQGAVPDCESRSYTMRSMVGAGYTEIVELLRKADSKSKG